MVKRKLSLTRCNYVIVTGKTLQELEKNVNDLIAQGWNAERFIGGAEKYENGFYQVMYLCPPSDKAKSAR